MTEHWQYCYYYCYYCLSSSCKRRIFIAVTWKNIISTWIHQHLSIQDKINYSILFKPTLFLSQLKLFLFFQAGLQWPHLCLRSSTALPRLDWSGLLTHHESPWLCLRVRIPATGQPEQPAESSASSSPVSVAKLACSHRTCPNLAEVELSSHFSKRAGLCRIRL